MRQASKFDGMRGGYWQFGVAVVTKVSAEGSRINLKVVSSDAAFDGDFPDAGGTEDGFHLLVIQECSNPFREPPGLLGGSKQKVCIEKNLHFAPWNSCSIPAVPIVSKSFGTMIWPAMKPVRRIWPFSGVSSALTLTIGLPALAMMKGSPLAASSTRRDTCVLAS